MKLSKTFKESLEILERLTEDGLMIVPVEPSKGMIDAASRASGICAEKVKQIYLTMVTYSDEEVPEDLN